MSRDEKGRHLLEAYRQRIVQALPATAARGRMLVHLDRLTAERDRYRAALESIAVHQWNNYLNRDDAPYSTGVTDGHRACAKIARRALADTDRETTDE